MQNPNEKEIATQAKNPRAKYSNQTQLLQGVAAVREPHLSLSERLCLFTLAAYTVRPLSEQYAHPGNAILMQACAVATRQGMNKVMKRLREKKLIEPMGHEQGGRGHATEYRICVEDPRFPWPTSKAKPATAELQDNEPDTRNSGVAGIDREKPATADKETRNCETGNPQLTSAKPATVELHPDSSTTDSKTTNSKEANKSVPVVMFCSGQQTANANSNSTTGELSLNSNAKPESKTADGPLVNRHQIANLREHAKRAGWSKKDFEFILRTNYGVSTPKELSMQQYVLLLHSLHSPYAPLVH